MASEIIKDTLILSENWSRARRSLKTPKSDTGIWTKWADWNGNCDEPAYFDTNPPEALYRIRDCVNPKNPASDEYLYCTG